MSKNNKIILLFVLFICSFLFWNEIVFAESTLLKGLTIKDYNVLSFNQNTKEYSIEIANNEAELVVNATPEDGDAKVEITGNKYLINNSGVITITVTKNDLTPTIYKINYIKKFPNYEQSFSYKNSAQSFTTKYAGFYKVSLWGAQGNNVSTKRSVGGLGAYTEGTIYLPIDKILYFYVGEHRTDRSSSFNAGTTGGSSYDAGQQPNGYGGGGATDVRLTSGTWNNVSSLRSRIMVAAGGGGASNYTAPANGGAAGGLVGYSGINGRQSAGTANNPPTGGTQIAGGRASILNVSGGETGSAGTFGIGGNGHADWGSAGGGGYYGGGGGGYTGSSVDSGAGGSSYISGHAGCVAITSASSSNPKVSTYSKIEDSYHYSNLKFTNTKIVDGAGYNWTTAKGSLTRMPTQNGSSTMVGNSGNGYATIKLVDLLDRNNYLEDLVVSTGELDKEFDPTITEYNLVIDRYKKSVNIKGIAYSDLATVEGKEHYDVEWGKTTKASFNVVSESGEIRTYTINITRKPLDEGEHSSKLVDLGILHYEGKLTPEFDSLTNNYNIVLSNNIVDVDVVASSYDLEATVKVEGEKLLLNDRGVIKVTVSAPDVEDTVYTINYVKSNIIIDFEYPYVGAPQVFKAPYTGYYNIELWGAQGNNVANLKSKGGLGSYTKGLIYLQENTVLYVYVGEHRTDRSASYNAGTTGGSDKDSWYTNGANGYGGGGATDIRVVNGAWNNTASLRSRIMVAAGGGGGSNYTASINGGNGGGLIGYAGLNGKCSTSGRANTPPLGGTQTSGGRTSIIYVTGGLGAAGTFGNGGNGNSGWGSGGGGGYYGGGGGGYTGCSVDSGAGGSSYISGHAGSIAIVSASNGNPKRSSYQVLSDSYHYSNYIFKDTQMVDGAGYSWTTVKNEQTGMPTQDKKSIMLGNSGNGFGKISYVELSANNYLENITVKVGEVEKNIEYDPTKDEYNLVFDPSEIDVVLSAKAYDEKATISGTGSFEVLASLNTYEINVVAENGNVKTYTINIERAKSNDAIPNNIEVNKMLNNLCSVDATYCNYEFDNSVLNYEIKLPFDLEEIELKADLKNKYQTVKYYQVVDDSDVLLSDGNIRLDNEGTYKVVVISEDEANTSTYTYHLVRDTEGNNLLKMITITNPDTQIKNFKPKVFEYYLAVAGSVTKFDVEAIAQNPNSTVEITGNDNFIYGQSNDVVIKVTAPNGAVRKYILHVYREQDTDVFLSDLQVKTSDNVFLMTPTFDPYLNNYTVEVDYEYENVEVVATLSDPANSSVTGTGVRSLNTGRNSVIIYVADLKTGGDINTYVVDIIRKRNSNAKLKSLSVENYDLLEEFDPDVKEYHVNIREDVTHLDVTAVPEILGTEVNIKGADNLYQAQNIITITTSAEDKSEEVYKIIVNKNISNNNFLKDIKVDNVSIPDFASDKLNYELVVPNDTLEVDVEGILMHESAKVLGNGKYAINTGDNIISLTVISESQEEKVYTINIKKELNDNTELLRVDNNRGSEVSILEDGSYVVNVQNEVNSIEIIGIPKIATSTVTGNGLYALNVGDNLITLTVIAENKMTKEYVVNVIRDKSQNDDLSFLYVEEGGLEPHFTETTVYYDVKIPNDKTQVHIEAIAEDVNAKVEIIGDTTNLVVNEPRNIIVRVTAEAGNTKDYNLVILRQEATEEDLSLLTLSTNRGPLIPDFDPLVFNYTLEVNNEISQITVSADANSENVSVMGTGTYDLRVGKNAIAVFVVGSDGIQRSYQIVVTRKASSDATLASLVVKGSVIDPTFNKNITSYNVNTSGDYLDFTAIIPTEKDATYEIIGNENFKVGSNTVTIKVTAPDKETTKDYVLTVTKSLSKNNNLSSLEVLGYNLTPVFHKGITYYTVDVPSDVNSVNIKATLEDSTATLTGVGIKKVEVGTNIFQVEVTSAANTTKVYTIVINKNGSDNNYLYLLYTSDGELNPNFDKSILEYHVNVEANIEEIEVFGILDDESATASGLGKHKLEEGLNIIDVVITSESGNTKIYQLFVTRAEKISADIISLEISNYELDTIFDPKLTEYYVSVDNEVTALDLKVVLEDSEATYEVLNNNLAVGINDVIIKVTARDNILTKEYKIVTNRQMSSNNYLESLEVSEGKLTPVFTKENLEYVVEVNRNIDKIVVNATTEDESAVITNGIGEHNLAVGENTINIKVKSAIGIIRTYKLKVIRKKSDNAYLSDIIIKNGFEVLSFNEEFVKTNNNYTLNVNSNVDTVQIMGVKEEELATVTGNGIKMLSSGENNFSISVTSEDGTLNIYNILITKDADVNNNVLDIVPSVGVLKIKDSDENATFVSSVHEYDLWVSDENQTLSFDVKLESAKAIVSGYESKPVVENSDRIVVITSESGAINSYTFHVIKESKSNALLDSLEVEHYPFEFDPNTFTYTIRTSVSKKKLLESEITAIAKDENATVNMMGDLDLTPGIVNIYTIEVIAKDSYTTQEYILNIIPDETSEYSLKSKIYDINRNNEEDYVIGIMPSTNIDDFKLNFDNNQELLHVYMNNVEASGLTATAMEIRLEKDGFIYDKLRVIVRGDLTSDGRVNVTDQVKLINYVGKVGTLDKYQMLAADLTFDSRVNVTDQVKLINYVGKVITNQDLNPKKEEEGS